MKDIGYVFHPISVRVGDGLVRVIFSFNVFVAIIGIFERLLMLGWGWP